MVAESMPMRLNALPGALCKAKDTLACSGASALILTFQMAEGRGVLQYSAAGLD